MNSKMPEVVREAFPLLSNATFVRRLAAPVPLVPDTTFDIFVTTSQAFLALVTTDYADPMHQSLELKDISGQYAFEFINLLKPHGKNNEVIEVLDHDKMEGGFFVDEPYKSYRLCYYVANIKSHSE